MAGDKDIEILKNNLKIVYDYLVDLMVEEDKIIECFKSREGRQ